MSEPVFDELRGSLDSAPTPVVLVDEAGRLAFVNVRAAAAFGYERVELLGAPIEILIPEWVHPSLSLGVGADQQEPENPASASGGSASGPRHPVLVALTGSAGGRERDQTPTALVGGALVRAEVRYLRKDGSDFREQTTLSRVSLDRPPGATQHTAERFQALFETTTAGMVEVDHDHRITAVNAAFCRMTGCAAVELIGTAFHDLLFPEDRDPTRALFGEIAQGERSADEADRRLRRADGTVLWVRVSAGARHEAGKPPGVSAVVIDQTDRKRLEEQLRRVQCADSIGLRASCLAHDFNNLLTVIGGCAGLLLDGVPEGPPRDLVLEMAAACRRGAGLTSQLLAIGRPATAELREFDLNAVATGALRLLRHLLGRNTALVANLAEGLPTVKADPTQMEQAILNLAINAKDAMPAGGVLTVETHAVWVRAEDPIAYPGLPPGAYVQLVVADTGSGMPNEVQERAFEPFFTTKPVGKGTGLGLAAVHALAAQCGGRADMYSEVGVGTVFELLFPAVATSALPSPRGTGPVPRCAGTVLLVERDGAARRLTRLALRAHGFVVVEAEGWAEGLAEARQHPGPIALVSAASDDDAPVPVVQPAPTPVSLVHTVRAALNAAL